MQTMSEDNRYSAPEATLHEPVVTGEYGSIEKGLAGDYEIAIGDTISEAWNATAGNKWTINGALFVYLLCFIMFGSASGLLSFMGEGDSSGIAIGVVELILELLMYGASAALGAALYVMGAKISVGQPTSFNDLFIFLPKIVKALGVYVLMMILIVLGFLALVLPGIYLSIAYLFAIPLALEKDMSIWQALETSRKVVTKRWWSMFGLGLVLGLLSIAGVVTLLIGFIWIAPLAVIAYGIAYRNMFGLEPQTISQIEPQTAEH